MIFYIINVQDLDQYSGYKPMLITAVGHVDNGTTVLVYAPGTAPAELGTGYTKEQFLEQFSGYHTEELL